MITREILNSHPVKNLKAELRKLKQSFNYSKLSKDELVDLMMKHKDKFNHIKMYEKPEKKPKKPRIPKIFVSDEPKKVKKKEKVEPKTEQFKIPKPSVKKFRIVPKDIKKQNYEEEDKNLKLYEKGKKITKEIYETLRKRYMNLPLYVKDEVDLSSRLIKLKPVEDPKEGGAKPSKPPPLNLEDMFKLYEKKSLDKPVPFSCYTHTYIFLLNAIMNKHKNDCAFIREEKKNEVFVITVKGIGKLYDRSGVFLVRDFEKLHKDIAKRYLECKKNKKLLVIPLSLEVKTPHANMLIFNYARNEVERFEPHGAKGDFYSDKTNNAMNKNLGIFIKGVSKHLDTNLKFIPPSEICPVGQKSFQDYENLFSKTGKRKFGNYEVIVEKDNGYCCAWSMLFLDIRLSEPKLSGSELTKKTIERYKAFNNWSLFKGFVRFIFNEALEVNIKALKKLEGKTINTHKIEKDDINEYLFYYYGKAKKAKNAGKLLAMTKVAEKVGLDFLKEAIKK